MSPRFINRTSSTKLGLAIMGADSLLVEYSHLMQTLRQKNDWKYGTNMTGEMVVKRLLQMPLEPIPVLLTKPLNPWSKMRASWDGEVISINVRYLNRPDTTHEKLVGSLIHEFCHVAGFKHGNNWRTKDKELFSVPYFAGIEVVRRST